MRIYDTYTRSHKELQTDPDGTLRMYVCGITVYDLVHIGHARSQLVFDTLVRYLKAKGVDVYYVRNFTDVDDKIIKRAAETGEDSLALSARMIDEFYADMDDLGLLRPDVEPKVSEHIPQIIELVQSLIDRGKGYAVEGDVFFSVESFPEYGGLSGRKIDEQREGARVDVDSRKRHPYDFALWKAMKPGEPAWDSPWGKGRPGWHIECSAMSMAYLGDTFHLHGGGDDLIFPHHENEIAQSICGTDGAFAELWMHNGMITTEGEKMSKSLGNFWTLRDVLRVHDPEIVRMFVLSKHYRSPVDYNDKSLHDALEGLRRLYRGLDHLRNKGGDADGSTAPSDGLSGELSAMRERTEALRAAVTEALDDDFNTAKAVGLLFEFAKIQCRTADENADDPALPPNAAAAALALADCASWMGLLGRNLETFEASVEARKRNAVSIDEAEVQRLVEARIEARSNRDWGRADEIRDKLQDMGVVIKDGPEGTTWSLA